MLPLCTLIALQVAFLAHLCVWRLIGRASLSCLCMLSTALHVLSGDMRHRPAGVSPGRIKVWLLLLALPDITHSRLLVLGSALIPQLPDSSPKPELADAGHRHPQTHDWTWHYSSERLDPAPSTRTQAQVFPTRKPS